MVSRRGLLTGTGLVGAGLYGGWAYGTGNLPAQVREFLPTGTLNLGDEAKFGELSVAVTDLATATSASYVLNNRARSWKAPEGGKLVLFKLEITNEDITKHEAPALNLRNYEVLEKEPNTLYIAGANDIRVFGGEEGAVLPEFKYQSIGVDAIIVHDRKLRAYPYGGAGNGPWVGPNQTVSGWVWGLVKIEKTPGLKIQTENNDAWWQHDDRRPHIVPAQNRTIEM